MQKSNKFSRALARAVQSCKVANSLRQLNFWKFFRQKIRSMRE